MGKERDVLGELSDRVLDAVHCGLMAGPGVIAKVIGMLGS